MGEYLSIDEVSLSQGELYTFVTNKAGKGKKGTMVASIKGTLSKDIITVLEKLKLDKHLKVKEVTLDMAKKMEAAVKTIFIKAILITDRFHVVKLAMEALQDIRINKRWEELDIENDAIKKATEENIKYEPLVLENGDTPKQLLARCRYILAKKKENWTESHFQRATMLFKRYPEIEHAYHQRLAFRNIYKDKNMQSAKIRFNSWINEIMEKEVKEFFTVANTVKHNLNNILNFFINRHTNANAESFNYKIKLFRAN